MKNPFLLILTFLIFYSLLTSTCKKEIIREIYRDTIETRTIDTIETIKIIDTVVIRDTIQTVDSIIIIRDTTIIYHKDSIIYRIDSIVGDKKITFNLFDNPFETGSSAISANFSTGLVDFNIDDYKDIDSISFIINGLTVVNSSGITTDKPVTIELMDLTNDSPIMNSKLISTGLSQTNFLASQNLLKSFPTKAFNLGMRLQFDNSNSSYWILKHASLILVRKQKK